MSKRPLKFMSIASDWSKYVVSRTSFISCPWQYTVWTGSAVTARILSDECAELTNMTTHFLVTDSITKCSNYIVAELTFAILEHNSSLIHTATIIFCLATRRKQSIKINHLNNHKYVLQCTDITSPNGFANESLKVVGSRACTWQLRSCVAGSKIINLDFWNIMSLD